MNVCGKPCRKKSLEKIEKSSKNQSKIAACEQKITTKKANFCSSTVFSLYNKIRVKKSCCKTTRFSLHFLIPRDKNHYSNLTSKIMKMSEQIIKMYEK